MNDKIITPLVRRGNLWWLGRAGWLFSCNFLTTCFDKQLCSTKNNLELRLKVVIKQTLYNLT